MVVALHGYKAVAPLRRLVCRLYKNSFLCSPRLQSRGPIATGTKVPEQSTGRKLSTATKPWPHCDVECVHSNSLPSCSPRLQSRGPIATRARGTPRASGPSLHGYKAVAPLRPQCPPAGRFCGRRLSTATKPWPHCDSSSPAGKAGTYALHGYKAVAPLRLADCCSGSGTGAVLSTATKPWPHCDTSIRGGRPARACSPRLQSRGPIATTWGLPPAASSTGSPRLQSRGPIATARGWRA